MSRDSRLKVRNVIYLIRHIESGKGYVGQTVGTAWRRWKAHLVKGTNPEGKHPSTKTAIARAIRKYGSDAFQFSVLEACASADLLNERETHWIAELGTLIPAGYNLKAGGHSSPMLPEVRAKIGRANTGKVKTTEWRANLRKAHLGKKLSEEQKRQISIFHTGRKPSAETLEKRRQSMLGKNTGPRSPEWRAAIAAGMSAEGKLRTRAAHLGVKRSEETVQRLKDAWVRRKARKQWHEPLGEQKTPL